MPTIAGHPQSVINLKNKTIQQLDIGETSKKLKQGGTLDIADLNKTSTLDLSNLNNNPETTVEPLQLTQMQELALMNKSKSRQTNSSVEEIEKTPKSHAGISGIQVPNNTKAKLTLGLQKTSSQSPTKFKINTNPNLRRNGSEVTPSSLPNKDTGKVIKLTSADGSNFFLYQAKIFLRTIDDGRIEIPTAV